MVRLPHAVPLNLGANVVTDGPASGVSAIPNSEHGLTQFRQLNVPGDKVAAPVRDHRRSKAVVWGRHAPASLPEPVVCIRDRLIGMA
eukprot:3634768-Alexandrium_andersonii.AAC.1